MAELQLSQVKDYRSSGQFRATAAQGSGSADGGDCPCMVAVPGQWLSLGATLGSLKIHFPPWVWDMLRAVWELRRKLHSLISFPFLYRFFPH